MDGVTDRIIYKLFTTNINFITINNNENNSDTTTCIHDIPAFP